MDILEKIMVVIIVVFAALSIGAVTLAIYAWKNRPYRGHYYDNTRRKRRRE